MHMRTPSTKVTYFLIFITLIVTGVITYNVRQKNAPAIPTTPEIQAANLAVVITNNYKETDTDSDGLMDWEETLRGTDIQNPDTDGDKTRDGAEIALGRNPNKPAPGDEQKSENLFDAYEIKTEVRPNTLTTQIARNLVDSIGQDPDVVVKDLLKQIDQAVNVEPVYKKENLLTFDVADRTKMKQYKKDLSEIPLQIGNKILEQTDEASRNYGAGYRDIATQLSIVPVPHEIAAIHTDYINNLHIMATYADILSAAEEDPVKIVAILPKLQEISDAQNTLLEQIQTYLRKHDIM